MRIDYISNTTWKDAEIISIDDLDYKITTVKMKWHNRDDNLVDERTLDVSGPGSRWEPGAESREWEKGDITLLHFLMAGVRGPARSVSGSAHFEATDFDVVDEDCRVKSEGRDKEVYSAVRFFNDEDVACSREWQR